MNATQEQTIKVSQSKLPHSQVKLEIEISGTETGSVYEKVVKDLLRNATIPGFRRGKVPRNVLFQRLGKDTIKANVLESLLQSKIDPAIKQENIKSLGNYQIIDGFEELVSNFTPGENFTFAISLDVPPEVTLGDYGNLSVKAEEVVFDPSTVDKYLEEQRAKESTLVPVEGRSAQSGDVAIVDYEGRFTDVSEGEDPAIPGASAKDFELELTEGRFIKDIVDGVIGMNIGETKDLDVNFPEDYPAPNLAGKKTIFTVTVKSLKEKELPAFDDDFAQKVSDCETMVELRELIETRFKEKAENKTKTNKEEALVAELVKLVEVELPETMIRQEVDQMLTQSAMQIAQMGMDIKQLFTADRVEQLRSASRPEAIDRLKQSLGLDEVAKQQSLAPTEEEIQTRFTEVKEELKDRDIDESRLLDLIESDLIREKAVQWLEERANIELVPEGSLKVETDEIGETDETETTTED
jgi:trigger factor